MAFICFDEETLEGKNTPLQNAVDDLRIRFAIDFVAMGPTAFVGAPLKWTYSSGATSERFKRITLAPGHGIGGIVLKAGKPMLFADVDRDIDPREYSSYPIVFAEDLHSFCCLPLKRENFVVGALLLGFRSSDDSHTAIYKECIEYLKGEFCGLEIISSDFLSFSQLIEESHSKGEDVFLAHTDLSSIIGAQEEERRRISRELHDGLAQELLTVSMQIDLAQELAENEQASAYLKSAHERISAVLDEIHNISVTLRPSTLDHLGLLAALRSQAAIYRQAYGVQIEFSGNYQGKRFDSSLEIQIYRIIQEAMLNACKYSGEDSVSVNIDVAGNWLSATVQDKGDGFNVKNPDIKGSGCGLLGMRERIAIVGGNLDIVSSPENGTMVKIVSPMIIGGSPHQTQDIQEAK